MFARSLRNNDKNTREIDARQREGNRNCSRGAKKDDDDDDDDDDVDDNDNTDDIVGLQQPLLCL